MRLYARGRATALRRWFGWLAGHGPVEGGPAAAGAWLSLVSGRPAAAERWAATAARAPQDAVMPDGSPLRAWVLMLRATMARDVQQMRRDAAGALQILAPGSQWRPTAASILGMAELFQGNLDGADQQLTESAELAADLGGPAAASVALAARAIIAIRRDQRQQARTLAEHASSVIQQAHLQDYATSALTYAVSARIAAHDGDPWTAREEISAADRALPLLTRALAHLAVATRLELARAHLTLSDAATAKDLLGEASQLLRAGGDLGSLHDDAGELAATVEQIQATAAGPSGADTSGTPAPPAPGHPAVVPGDRRPAVPLGSHRQSPGDLDLPQARRLIPHTSHRAGPQPRPPPRLNFRRAAPKAQIPLTRYPGPRARKGRPRAPPVWPGLKHRIPRHRPTTGRKMTISYTAAAAQAGPGSAGGPIRSAAGSHRG
jgi:tetratricopeptide (TPR) repeat protein